MNKKLPKIYKSSINKTINNNKKVDYVSKKVVSKNKDSDIFDINTKISDILNSNRHFFNTKVLIETKDKQYKTKLAGKIKDYIITLDNDIIFIKDIINIEILK